MWHILKVLEQNVFEAKYDKIIKNFYFLHLLCKLYEKFLKC